jgi:hypothetical protein
VLEKEPYDHENAGSYQESVIAFSLNEEVHRDTDSGKAELVKILING